MKINTKSLLYGTFILTAANFFVRILGFIYRVFLSRYIGAEGMGLVQLIFPLYMVSITLTSSGIPVAVSRLVSQQKAVNNECAAKKTIRVSLILVSLISICISLLLFINMHYIAANILKDIRTLPSLFIFSPCIIMIALGAVLKGYFYGLKDIHPSALAEIIEQIVRMILVFLLLLWLPPLSIEMSAAVVVLGMVIGELASLLYLHYRYHHSAKLNHNNRATVSTSFLLKNIIAIAAPVTFTRLVSSVMMAANSILIPQRLIVSGMSSHEAIGTFGIVSGMVMPLLFFPFTLTSALSVVIIPNLSENVALKNWSNIRDKTAKSLLITCLSAFPSMAILIPLGQPLGLAIYNHADVGKYLVPLAFATIFFCLQHSMGSVLNGLGKQNRSAVHFLIGGAIQILCTYYLIAQPRIGINGFIIGFCLNTLTVSFLNFITAIQVTKLRIEWMEWFIKPGLAALLMGLMVRLVYLILIDLESSYVISLMSAIMVGLLIFITISFLLGILPYSMIKMIKNKLRKLLTGRKAL